LCRRYGVRKLELFGSATDGAFDPRTSDLDFLVDFDPGYCPIRGTRRWRCLKTAVVPSR